MTKTADAPDLLSQADPPNGVASTRYHLEHRRQRLEVESENVGLGHRARLFVDGRLRDERSAKAQRAELHADKLTVRVDWGDFGGVRACELVVDDGGQCQRVAFTPPTGSRAARLAQFQHDQPGLYAARHLVKPVLQALIPLLGLGTLLSMLLPRFNWNWLPPFIQDKLFGDGPTWLEPILDSPVIQVGKWLVPILLALFLAVDEYEKRRKPESRGENRGPHR